MGLLQRLRRLVGQSSARTTPTPPPLMGVDEPEPQVRELSASALQEGLAQPTPPLLLDVREPYEWRQVRITVAQHIPMGELPNRLDELEPGQPIVVVCAHGMRSYSVAAWLEEQGFDAASLQGGITEWSRQGGPIEQGDIQ